MGRTKTCGATQVVPVWIAYKRFISLTAYYGDNYRLDRTKTFGAFQAVPVWNIQATFLNYYKHSEPTMSERDQDAGRLASGAGLDRSNYR